MRILGTAIMAAIVLQLPQPAGAQAPSRRWEVLRGPNGELLDFAPDGGWRVKASRVAAYRQALIGRRDFASLNAPMAGTPFPSPAAITGTERIPTLIFEFADHQTASTLFPSASSYDQVLFGTNPAAIGRPYSIRTFFEQLSSGIFSMQGQVVGWITLAGNEIQYTGNPQTDGCSGNPFGGNSCNGIFSNTAFSKMLSGFTQVLQAADTGTFNWGNFDNDGPDGVPNSGDDNGIVDQVLFVHSEQDGACGPSSNNHLWSHRSSSLSYTTHTPWAGHPGQFIRVRDYTLQSGVGGSTGCSASTIMGIGTAAHEAGHTFGLPDLYDTQASSEGIGEWGLMGSGNYSTSFSPTRMEAWSLSQLGWITVVPVTTTATYLLGPAPTSDTAFMIRVQGANPRGEFYLVENRQASQSDTAMIRVHCGASSLTYPTNCHGGLAIWHVDSVSMRNFGFASGANSVNSHNPHGLLLVQPDNLGQLEKAQNRGNAGDLWPGYGTGTPKTAYTATSTPQAIANDSLSPTGFQIDSIRQVNPDGAMSFRVRLGGRLVIRALDTLAKVTIDGTPYGRYDGGFAPGSVHPISMTSPQLVNGNRSQYTFVSWSDGGAQTHNVTGTFQGDSITLNVALLHKVTVAKVGSGTVSSSPNVDLTNGAFLPRNSLIQLTAGQGFVRWTGDTASTSNPLNLTLTRPFAVTAEFIGNLMVTSTNPPDGVMGKAYSFTFAATGGTSPNTWSKLSGSLPAGLSLTSDGILSGTLAGAGSFSAVVQVASGTQTSQVNVNISVTEPTLATTNVLGHLLGTTNGLSADEVKYLDLIGNNNGTLDVGDFLAWVNRTNAQPSSP